MRKYLSENNKSIILVNHEERILKLEESFNKFSTKEKTIIYEGKIYDAFSILLDILRKVDKKIIIMSKNMDELLIKKYKSQYQNVEFINTNVFHDRYIILDRNIAVECL